MLVQGAGWGVELEDIQKKVSEEMTFQPGAGITHICGRDRMNISLFKHNIYVLLLFLVTMQQDATRHAKSVSDGTCTPLSSSLGKLTLQPHPSVTPDSYSSVSSSSSSSVSSLSSDSTLSESD